MCEHADTQPALKVGKLENQWHGATRRIDDVAVWDRVLSDTEIQARWDEYTDYLGYPRDIMFYASWDDKLEADYPSFYTYSENGAIARTTGGVDGTNCLAAITGTNAALT